MLAIYRINLKCYYGRIHGIFCANKEDIDALIGEEIYFGEVLGKHSEVMWEFESKDIEMVTDNKEAVEWFTALNMETGYNPVKLMKERESE